MNASKRRVAIETLRQQIEVSISQELWMLVRRFTESVALGRRTKKSVAEVNQLLHEYGIHVSPEGTNLSWADCQLDTIVRLSLGGGMASECTIAPGFDYVYFASSSTSEEYSLMTHSHEDPREVPGNPSPTGKDKNLSLIEPGEGTHPHPLYPHQREAIQKLDAKLAMLAERRFAGLLVIPTGGGKTRTAVHWALRNVINNEGKVLWIAHRHELLEQARDAFEEYAHQDLLDKRERFSCRLISGQHAQAVELTPDDDVVVASIHSLSSGSTGQKHLLDRWVKKQKELFVVIDEAHHAPARTYRNLVKALDSTGTPFSVLGLTATPFRTMESERGQLKEIFPDDIVYRIGLNELISRGILSEPIFRAPETQFKIQDEAQGLTESDMQVLRKRKFNLEALGESVLEKIAKNRDRNRAIVNHWLEERNKYGQTLVFALNVVNAVALNKLFREEGVKSEFVVGSVQDALRARNISPKENREAIRRFRNGETEVLINVNILTEGTDIPGVQTVFLTRPTVSKVLMMQMIGRGLRGSNAKSGDGQGGTKETYIVTFIDNWEDKINWVSPEHLFIDENVDFNDKRAETRRLLVRLISLEKIEEFARILDQTVDTRRLAAMPFLDRVPVGVYTFSLLSDDEDVSDQTCDVLVYSSTQSAFDAFIGDLPTFLERDGCGAEDTRDWLPHEALEELAIKAEAEYFREVDSPLGYNRDDLARMIQRYYTYGLRPTFIAFDERVKFNLDEVAQHIFDNGLGGRSKVEYVDNIWDGSRDHWQVFFGCNKRVFVREINLALERLEHPFPIVSSSPQVEHGERPLETFSLSALRESHPEYAQKLVEEVYQRARLENGEYRCAISQETSPNRRDFEIDHKIPFSEGGLTTLENLQLLLRKENRRKGNKME